LMQG